MSEESICECIIVKHSSHVKEKIRIGDTVSIGSYSDETGKITEIKGGMVKVDVGPYSVWIPENVTEKHKCG